MSMDGAGESTEVPVSLKLFRGAAFAAVAAVFAAPGGIGGVKTIKSFCGIPLTFICLLVMLGFICYMAKRPRTRSDYACEEEAANAPDNKRPPENGAGFRENRDGNPG
jgi:glycine betaine transporter